MCPTWNEWAQCVDQSLGKSLEPDGLGTSWMYWESWSQVIQWHVILLMGAALPFRAARPSGLRLELELRASCSFMGRNLHSCYLSVALILAYSLHNGRMIGLC